MISKFFIDRPVLANVLAIVIVLIGGGGAVHAAGGAISRTSCRRPYRSPRRYPGASAETVMNTVALPIEQQVNGVQDMLYMQSTSASDGTYTLTVTFEIGTDLNFAQVLVQNRVATAMASLPQAVQVQGVTVQQKSTSILQIVTLTSPDGRYDSLFLSNYATINLVQRACPPSRRRQRQRVRCRPIFHAHLARSADSSTGARPDAEDVIKAIQQQSQQVTAGPDRCTAGAAGPGLPVHRQRRGTAGRPGRIRQHHRQDRQRQRRPDHPGEGRRARRTGRADLFPVVHG